MCRVLLGLAAAVLVGACSDVNPAAPDTSLRLQAGGALAAKAFPEQQNGGRPIETPMTGAEEAPGPGDPDGTSNARLTFNPGQEEVCFALTVENIAPATAAHIHIAPVGEPGPVVVPLSAPTTGSVTGCVPAERELIVDIIQNPDAYYVNVHNAEFPGGAVRGQLTK